MRRENDRHFASFTFCASGYEKPPAHDFMGYRTLDTKNGFHKPLLNAYKLLHKLAPELVPVEVSSSGVSVAAFATRDAERVTVVLVNYQPDQFQNRGAGAPIRLNLTPPWAPGTRVLVRHWRIDDQHSNAYTAFKELGSPDHPTAEQIATIKQRMELEQLEPPRSLTTAALGNLTFALPCNAVSLIEVTRLP